MAQPGDHSVLHLGQSRWGSAPVSEGEESLHQTTAGGAAGTGGEASAFSTSANGTGVRGGDLGSTVAISALGEGGPEALALSSALSTPSLRGLREDDHSIEGGAGGVLRPGYVGLAPSPTAMLLTTGGAAATPEPPPSGAKVLGGGYRTDIDETEHPSVLATSAIDPEFHSEFLQERSERLLEEERLGTDNWSMCQAYFYVGCVALPLLHFVNVFYFLLERRKGDRNVVLRSYALSSCVVAMFWVIVSVIWLIVYQVVLSEKIKWLGIQNVDLGPELI